MHAQAVFNCRRRSTQGWSILNILLDFMGGALSLGQQLLTCWWAGNWAPVRANPVKLGLAATSMGMDLVFMLQHYVLYPEPPEAAAAAAGTGRRGPRAAALVKAASLPLPLTAGGALDLSMSGSDLGAPLLGSRSLSRTVTISIEDGEALLSDLEESEGDLEAAKDQQ
jgi:hypothetical protein